jgi:hypothetical protein
MKRCRRCGSRAAYRDVDGGLVCLCCGRPVSRSAPGPPTVFEAVMQEAPVPIPALPAVVSDFVTEAWGAPEAIGDVNPRWQ